MCQNPVKQIKKYWSQNSQLLERKTTEKIGKEPAQLSQTALRKN